MLCQECGVRPATLHWTRIVNAHKEEVHLCEQCARHHPEFQVMGVPDLSLALSHLLAGLTMGGAAAAPAAPTSTARCATCGTTFAEFAETGRLGCPDCYRSFAGELAPVVARVQAGTRHRGKLPARRGSALRRQRRLEDLRAELAQAIEREDYERAAVIRDTIRQLERQGEGGKQP